jgi:hypothetical protein
MNVKRTLAGLAVTGGTAAALFGGTVVHTALTSDTPLTFTAGGATVSGSAATGTVVLNNMQPGETHDVTLGLDNSNSTIPVNAYITFTGFTPFNPTDHPNLNDLVFQAFVNGQWTNIALNGTPLELGSLTAGETTGGHILIGLAQSTGNSWNGVSGVAHYVVHFQDSNGTDGNGYVASNNG